jgi:hypothetical protein
MDREERELFQNLLDRLDAQSGTTPTNIPQPGSINPGSINTPKQERPNIYNIGRTSMFGGNTSNMMPDPKFFRKLLGIDI